MLNRQGFFSKWYLFLPSKKSLRAGPSAPAAFARDDIEEKFEVEITKRSQIPSANAQQFFGDHAID
jgi:hypothetical protein